MARARKGDKEMAEGLELENFVLAGTSAAFDALGANCEDPSCVRCGSPISYVFVTNKGAMGGDCLATLTGDNSSRKVARKLVKTLERELSWGWRLSALVVEQPKWDQWAGKTQGAVYAKMWHPERSRYDSFEGTYSHDYKNLCSFDASQETMMRAYVGNEAEGREVEFTVVDDVTSLRVQEAGW